MFFHATAPAQTPATDSRLTTPSAPRPTSAQPPGGARAEPSLALPDEVMELAPSSAGAEFQPKVILPPAPGQGAVPPPPTPAGGIPRVIPIEPEPNLGQAPAGPQSRVVQLRRDSTGLVPGRPPGPPPRRSNSEVAKDVSNLIDVIKEPEAEISVVMGESRIVQTRRTLTRMMITNPAVADVEILGDQLDGRLLNVFGKSFGTTSLTLWDETNRPVSFLVRVTLDTKELETRINQAFPGAQVKVRQLASQLILDGQVPDSKMMSDILQVVQTAVRFSGGIRAASGGGGAGAMGGGAGGMAMGGGGGGMGGGGMGGGGMGGGGMMGGLTIINRVVVPGPRQVLLHVKIAVLNRTAIRQIGINWLDTKGRSIIGSSIGGSEAGAVSGIGNASHSTGASNPIGFLSPVTSTFSGTGNATSGGQLFGVFDAGHFSLFINALRSNALAKILAEPNLMALDGQPARFLSGGYFPFPVPQSSSIPGGTAVVTVQFRRFGTILNFIP